MQDIVNAYIRLLTDVSRRQNVSLDAPEELDTNWILIEAPKLDKALLQFLETGQNWPLFPEWLMPLSEELYSNLLGYEPSFLAKADWMSQSPSEPGPHELAFAGKILKDLRQLLVFGYKAETKPNAEQQSAAQAAFVETDEGCAVFDVHFERIKNSPLFRHAKALIGKVICRIDYSQIRPSHGPGAVFPSCKPSSKSNFVTIYDNLDQVFPYYEYLGATLGRIEDWRRADTEMSTSPIIKAKLTAVPKDSRGPRLIAVHPKESVWIQQGLRKELELAIDRNHLTRECIKFKDQEVNGRLAFKSSLNRRYATIDLKDASDCISRGLFNYLFGGASKWFNACRATHIQLLDGSLHELQKYGPMGNATVFPIESLIFWALAKSSIMAYCGVNCNDVYVFGDDIIVPSKYYGYVMKGLIRAGLRPNSNKSFHRGFFRESCGVDAFFGVDVTPHRIKKWRLSSLSDRISMCSLAKNMRADGYEETASFLYQCVRRREGRLPLGNNPKACGIYEYVDKGWMYLLLNEDGLKWSNKLHIYVTPIVGAAACIDKPSSHDWYHVLDSLIRLRDRRDYAIRFSYSLPRRVRRKRGWTQALFEPQQFLPKRFELHWEDELSAVNCPHILHDKVV